MDEITNLEIKRIIEIIRILRSALKSEGLSYTDDTLQRLAVTIYLESGKKIYFANKRQGE